MERKRRRNIRRFAHRRALETQAHQARSFLSRYENLAQGENIDGSELGDDEFCLLPNRVCAYILQRRRFAILKLNCLRPQGPDPQNWNDLFLTRDNKETVKAQTMSHFRNKRLRAANPDVEFDLSREKGLGLIILLHGVPGVGMLTPQRDYCSPEL
jgi:hypothetical protein